MHVRFRGYLNALLTCSVLIWALPTAAQMQFIESGAEHGLKGYRMPVGPTGGIAAADFDNDGDIDLFVPNGEGAPNQLYRNLGNGQYEEIAAAVGLDSLENHRVGLWFDYDNDQRLDLVVGGDCRSNPMLKDSCGNPANLRLYHQEPDGQFTDTTIEAGLDIHWGGKMDHHRSGIVAGDIDNDGDLDLYVNDWGERAYVYRNNDDGTFSDVTLESGMTREVFRHQQPIMYDFNRDGWLDIYVAVDIQTPNFLWLNRGDGTFVEWEVEAGMDNAMTDMGLALGDYDNDLDIDVYITNITRTGDHNVLLRNVSRRGQLKFKDVTSDAGVKEGYWGWGTTFFDADNDGRLDLAATNGKNTGRWWDDPSLFYYNLGGNPVRFDDRSEQVGLDDTFIGASLVAADFDRDGDLDLFQTTSEAGELRLLENRPGEKAANHNFLVIKPRINGPNHFAIGSEVRAISGNHQQMRLIRTATSTLGQEPAEAFFGLGTDTVASEVIITWPDGTETRLGDVAANQVLTVEKGLNAPTINSGFSDAWFNAESSGQGLFIIVFPGLQQLFAAWFTFDAEAADGESPGALPGARQRWFTAQGPYEGNRAELDIYVTRGGEFDSTDSSPKSEPDGRLILDFSDCKHGTAHYRIASTGHHAIIPIQRITPDLVPLCEAQLEPNE